MNVMAGDSQGVRTVTVDENGDGQRLDNFLIARLKGVPRSHVYRIVRSGEVRVNRGRARPSQRLVAGDLVRIPPLRLAHKKEGAAVGPALLDALDDWILYEDAGLLALNKPSGLAVHGGSGLSYGLIEALRQLRADAPYLELVHRLDRETSGCVLVAKKRAVLRHLHQALSRPGEVEKRYLALVAGRWPRRRTRVRAALKRDVLQSGERMVRTSTDGKESETRFRLLHQLQGCSLVEAMPLTGRTHQIRVHALAAGHPVAGDGKYGQRDFNRHMRELGLRRLFLHAAAISVPLLDGRRVEIRAAMQPELIKVLEKLGIEPDDAALHI